MAGVGDESALKGESLRHRAQGPARQPPGGQRHREDGQRARGEKRHEQPIEFLPVLVRVDRHLNDAPMLTHRGHGEGVAVFGDRGDDDISRAAAARSGRVPSSRRDGSSQRSSSKMAT